MGLTHYWKRPPVLPTEAFGAAVRDCRKVLTASGVALAGETGQGRPVINDLLLVFNGQEPLSGEPFRLEIFAAPRRGGSDVLSYCKTCCQPYDLCVKAVLVVFSHHFSDIFKVFSDGKDDLWQDARRLCQECLGYGLDFQLSKPEE